VDLEEYGMSPALITKKDGSSLYITRDIAAALYRKERYDFYKNLYIVASQQNLHFQQWFKIIELLGFPWYADCVHIPFGLVSLEDGVMSTREGRVIFLEDVLNRAVNQTREIVLAKNVNTDNVDVTAKQVGIGAVIFQELSNNRIKDYVFSWDKVLNFEGETGPYVQYTHARACSVLRNGGASAEAALAGIIAASGENAGAETGAASGAGATAVVTGSASETAAPINFDLDYITGDSAYELAKLIYKFPEVVLEAGEKYEPSVITRHIVDIAQNFNKFYHDEHILVENEAEKQAKLLLVFAARQALASGLSLLGIEAPERM